MGDFLKRNAASKTFWTALGSIGTAWVGVMQHSVTVEQAIGATLAALLILFNRDTTAKAAQG